MKSISNLRLLRVRAGITQDALASLIGISQTRISFIENGKKKPTPREIREISEALGEDPTTIFAEDHVNE